MNKFGNVYLTHCNRLNHIFLSNTKKFVTITDPYKHYQNRSSFLNAIMPNESNVFNSIKDILFVDLETGKQIAVKQEPKNIAASSSSGIVSANSIKTHSNSSNEVIVCKEITTKANICKKVIAKTTNKSEYSDTIKQGSFSSIINGNIEVNVNYLKKRKITNRAARDESQSPSLKTLKVERDEILKKLSNLDEVTEHSSKSKYLNSKKIKKPRDKVKFPGTKSRYFSSVIQTVHDLPKKCKSKAFKALKYKKLRRKINEKTVNPLEKPFDNDCRELNSNYTNTSNNRYPQMERSNISPNKEILGNSAELDNSERCNIFLNAELLGVSAELDNSVIDEDKCSPEISMPENHSEGTTSLQCKREDVSLQSLENDKYECGKQLQYDVNDMKAIESLSMPSTSSVQAESTPSDQPEIETVDFMEKKNIVLKNIEYSIPIHFSNKRSREYYDSIRPMVSGRDLKTFSPNAEHCKFTILNYNVLSQRLLLDNIYLYNDCPKEYLQWEYRWNLLQHEIKRMCPSILTLQEIDEHHYTSHFLPWLSYYGYKGIYKKRTGNKRDGCAIFFKADVFDVIEHKSVQYRQKRVPNLDRDNIGLMVKLSPKHFYQPFCVSTTHFLYNPKRSDIRLMQMAVLLAELDRFCYTGEEAGIVQYCPVILTGDFNSDPNSAVVQFLCQSKLKYDELDRKSLLCAYGNPSIGNQLIPPSLGISNYCHHTVLDKGRSLDRMRGSLYSLADRRKLEESLISLNKPGFQSNNSLPDVGAFSGSPGTLYHRFNFESVYNFAWEEVTTFHKSWIMVDYIFYSQVGKHKKSRGNPLALLEKYQLPGLSFAQRVGALPCGYCPSDHFPLAATFALTKQGSQSAKSPT